MAVLPDIIYKTRISSSLQTTFGSYMHTKSAANGDFYDMKNLSSDLFPLLSTRKPRRCYKTLTKPNGLYSRDGLYYVDKTSLYYNGTNIDGLSLENSEKTFCSLGKYIIIFPDKKYYDTETKAYGSLEAEFSSQSIKFKDGSYEGEPAKLNTIYCQDANANFKSRFNEGDAITITIKNNPTHENNKTIIIREIPDDNTLVFYENSFVSYPETNPLITLSRKVPEMDFVFENENRLWGCKGSEIYASKLGDIFNWNVFDGISTDSYAAAVGSAGDFTGAISFMGYPCFFKDDHIYKVYGDKPSNFQIMSSASIGVSNGCGKSLAIAGEMLFYLSRTGICVYSGGMPANISEAFGEDRYEDAVGGSDGVKYYVSMKKCGTDEYTLFVYDTRYGVWMKEDNKQILSFAFDKALYMLDENGNIDVVDNGYTPLLNNEDALDYEDDVEWYAEFADIYEYSTYRNKSTALPGKKETGKLQIRLELEEGASIEIEALYDSIGEWIVIGELSSTRKKSFILPVIPRRNDHYKLRLSGKGKCIIYSITRDYYQGSEY